jgi:hypothetical protein
MTFTELSADELDDPVALLMGAFFTPRRRRERYMPLVALCLRHFLADSRHSRARCPDPSIDRPLHNQWRGVSSKLVFLNEQLFAGDALEIVSATGTGHVKRFLDKFVTADDATRARIDFTDFKGGAFQRGPLGREVEAE